MRALSLSPLPHNKILDVFQLQASVGDKLDVT